jgi:hypothetical protein
LKENRNLLDHLVYILGLEEDLDAIVDLEEDLEDIMENII